MPVPHLAAGGDGRADAGQHVPALGDDGEGRRLPRRPARAGLRRPRHVAPGRRDRRRRHDDRRRAAGPAPDRPQAAARRWHDQPARVHDRRVRLGHADRRTRPAAIMLLAHGAFKAAAFMVVGIVDHQHGTRDVRLLPRPGPGWRGVLVVAVGRRRRRWPASRCCSASSPRRPTSTPSSHQGAGAALALAGLVVGSVLTVAYSIRFVAGVAGRLADERRRRPARRSTTGRRRRLPRRRPPSSPSPASLFGVLPRLVDGLVGAAADALDRAVGERPPGAVARLQHRAAAVGGGPRRRHRALRRPAAVGRGRCSRPGGGSRRPPTPTSASLRGLNAVANRVTAVAQPGSLPVYLGVILLTAAVVPRRPAAQRLVVAGLAAARRGPGPRPDRGDAHRLGARRGDRPPALLRRPVPRDGRLLDGRAVHRPGRARPGADPGRHRDAVDRAVRARAAPAARPLRDDARRRPARPSASSSPPSSAGSVFLFTLAVGSVDPPTTVSDTMIEQALPGGRRAQRRQRDPRRHPRLRHARRDHACWPPRRSAPSPSPGPGGAPAGPAVATRHAGAPPAAGAADPPGDDRRVGAHRVRRRDGRLAVAAVRRAQPARRRLRRRHRRRRRGRPALRRRRPRARSAGSRAAGRGWSSAPAC